VRAMLPAHCRLGVGIRLFYPEMKSARDIVDRTQAAIQAGASEIHYYNYGLVPAARLDWVRAAIDTVTANGG
jgi:2-iminoacetate synthase ThiH